MRLPTILPGPGIVPAALLLLSSSMALAENDAPPPDTADPIDELLVTGIREAARRGDQAVSSGVLTGSAIAALRPLNASDIMERIPGVHITWLGGDHHGTSIRQPISFEPVYLFLENGIPIRSTGFFNVNTFIEMNVPQAARIEVIKGPGTALYGSDALGGIINMMTARPDTGDNALTVEGGAFGFVRALASLSGGTDARGLRADVNITHTDGWRAATRYDRQLATLTWTGRAGNAWRIRTVLSGGHVNQQSSGSNLTREAFDNTPRVNFAPMAERRIRSLRLYSILEREDGPALLSISPYFRYNEMTLLPAFSLSFDPHIEDTSNASLGAMIKYRRDFPALAVRWVAGLDIDFSPGQRRDRQLDTVKDGDFFLAATPNGNILYDFDATYRAISPYIHVEKTIAGRAHLTLGLRYDALHYNYDNKLDVVSDPAAPFKRPASTGISFDRASPKAGLTFDISPGINAFFSYREAFRVPTASQLFRPGSSAASVDLVPVKARNYEAGIRGHLASRIGFEITAYRLVKRDDILAFTDTMTGIRTNINAGKTLHRGIESGFDIDLGGGWALHASYAYNQHIFKQWRPNTATDFTGNRQQRAPKDVGNMRLSWRPPVLRGGRIELEWVHLGSYFEDDENSRKYEGHNLLNLRATAPLSGRLEARLRVQNLTDKRYAVLARFTRFQGETVKPGLPLSVYGGLTLGF